MYGQPIADLRTGRITHHELLVRMLSEDGDIIPPAAFLPMAERFGVIGEIDRWVTNAGLRLAIDGEGVAINLSGYSIGDQAIVAEIRSAIADGVDPGKVIFDVTEAAAMTKLEATRQFAGTLYGLGCSLALDDFGTGFSSFTFLKHIPARYLKIDMGFVRELASSKLDHQVVKSIVGIARCLDKRTIAEGVQDADTLGVLKAIGADYAQGFHFGAPKRLSPPTAFERQLPRRPGRPAHLLSSRSSGARRGCASGVLVARRAASRRPGSFRGRQRPARRSRSPRTRHATHSRRERGGRGEAWALAAAGDRDQVPTPMRARHADNDTLDASARRVRY